MLDPETIDIWRAPEGHYELRWDSTDPGGRVRVGPADEALSHQVEYPQPGSAIVSGLVPGGRHLFRLRDDYGSDITAGERRIHLDGTPNLRDLGGYLTADGRRTRWGCLFRSSQLSDLSETDLQRLQDLRLDLVFDLRRELEQEAHPAMLPTVNQPRLVSLPIAPGNQQNLMQSAWEGPRTRQAMEDFMIEVNTRLADSQTEKFAAMFASILDTPTANLLVNCAAGKDRTGFAVALILSALGVGESIIFRDYLLSARYFLPETQLERVRQKYQMQDMENEVLLPMLQVQSVYLRAALDTVRQQHANVETYLEKELGVGSSERAELARRYLL